MLIKQWSNLGLGTQCEFTCDRLWRKYSRLCKSRCTLCSCTFPVSFSSRFDRFLNSFSFLFFRYPAVTVTGTDVQVVRRRFSLWISSFRSSIILASDSRTNASDSSNSSFSDYHQFCTFWKWVRFRWSEWIELIFSSFRKYMLVDACEAEEKVMEGVFAVGMNQHKELSTLTMLGEICLNRDQVWSNMKITQITRKWTFI